MSPIKYIKEGIHTGNWNLVCKGYERLTGEILCAPIAQLTIQNAENALRQVADMLSNILDVQQKPTVEQKTTSKKKVGRPKGSKKKTNKSEQTDEHTDDATLNINAKNKTVVQRKTGETQLITNEPDPEEVKRNKLRAKRARKEKLVIDRPVATTYNVKCNECESEFKSNRPGGEMGQKCKKCLSDKKSRFA